MELIAILIFIGIWVFAAGQRATVDAINNSNSCCDYTPWHWGDDWEDEREEKHDPPPAWRLIQEEQEKARKERIALFKAEHGDRWFIEFCKETKQ